ncbi:MAG: hypothetical protein LAP21_21115 [Acidobacteriia bacterium]|nr:hypothetical protein [Terriglobia bacterium]
MEDLRDELASVVERLTARVQELERRVSTLERHPETVISPRPGPATAVPHPLQDLSLARSGGAMAVVGRVFLGMAGAYLLRAVAESAAFPRLAVAPVALAYAGMWLVWAARVGANARFAGSAYGITSALILTPMLWELTWRFKVLPAAATAGVLVAFVAAASALAWKRSLAPVVWAAALSAAITALALMIATRDLVPFTLALLAMALMTEAAACRDHWRSLRPIGAVAADFAIFSLTMVYARTEFLQTEYKPVAAGVLLALPPVLFAIYAGSTIFRTVVLRREITFFEVGQTVVSLLLAATGVLYLTAHQAAAAVALGVFCLLAAVACYFAALARFERSSQPRNYHVFAAWAAAFFLAGSFLCLPPAVLALWLGLAALVAVFAGVRWARLTLGFHGVVYLAAAAWVSGLLDYTVQAMVGVSPAAPARSVWMAAALVVLGFAIAWRSAQDQTAQLGQQLLRLFCATLALCAVAALAVAGIAAWMATAPGAAAVAMSGPRLAVVRTLVTCMAALALAMSGSRWKRAELVWLAYAAMAFCTLKLLFEDLRYGNAGSLAVSLFLYGMVWVLVPRLVRTRLRQTETQE